MYIDLYTGITSLLTISEWGSILVAVPLSFPCCQEGWCHLVGAWVPGGFFLTVAAQSFSVLSGSPVRPAPLIFSWEPPQLNNQEQPAGKLAASTQCWGCKQAPRTSQEPPCLPPNDRCFCCHRSEVTDTSRSVSYLTAHCQGCLLAFGTVLHFPCLLCQGPAQSSRQSLAPR